MVEYPCNGLDLEELAIVLQIQDEEVISAVYEAALYVKNAIYGRRMVFFAPLYVSNVCANNCLYCGFRRGNTGLVRRVLTMEEVNREVEILLAERHKRILLVAGEHPKRSGIDYIEQEYLLDYADAETQMQGDRIIANELEDLEPHLRNRTMELLAKVENGERDVYM